MYLTNRRCATFQSPITRNAWFIIERLGATLVDIDKLLYDMHHHKITDSMDLDQAILARQLVTDKIQMLLGSLSQELAEEVDEILVQVSDGPVSDLVSEDTYTDYGKAPEIVIHPPIEDCEVQ